MRKGISKATKDYQEVKIQLIDHDLAGEHETVLVCYMPSTETWYVTCLTTFTQKIQHTVSQCCMHPLLPIINYMIKFSTKGQLSRTPCSHAREGKKTLIDTAENILMVGK